MLSTRRWPDDLADIEAILEARRRREKWWKPGLWMVRSIRHRTVEARLATKHAYQRVARGWDDTAVWSIHDHLSKSLGEQLLVLSEIHHVHPVDYPPEQWGADLKRHGEALLTHQRMNYEVHGDEWEALYGPAQDALRWVADNLASLWD
jgi:hypothetical protein